jgi:hypothetical protein
MKSAAEPDPKLVIYQIINQKPLIGKEFRPAKKMRPNSKQINFHFPTQRYTYKGTRSFCLLLDKKCSSFCNVLQLIPVVRRGLGHGEGGEICRVDWQPDRLVRHGHG